MFDDYRLSSESLLANIEVVKDESQKGPIEAATSLTGCSAALPHFKLCSVTAEEVKGSCTVIFNSPKSLQKEDN